MFWAVPAGTNYRRQERLTPEKVNENEKDNETATGVCA
jgi:hypothetical protein